MKSVFCDARAIATTPALLGSFLSFPHHAVLSLLNSDTMLTDAEATVLLLLSEWCHGDRGKACTKEELQELNACIRYSRLSMPYLTELCTHLHTPLLTLEERMELLHFDSLSEYLQGAILQNGSHINPSGWYLPRRKSQGDAHTDGVTLTLKVPQADLYALLQAIKDNPSCSPFLQEISSKAVYAQGFWWMLQLARSHESGLWCGIVATGVSSLLTQDANMPLHLGISSNHSMKLVGKVAAQDTMFSVMQACLVNSNGTGNEYFSPGDGDNSQVLEREWWEPYVVDGSITLIAEVLDIV